MPKHQEKDLASRFRGDSSPFFSPPLWWNDPVSTGIQPDYEPGTICGISQIDSRLTISEWNKMDTRQKPVDLIPIVSLCIAMVL